MRADGQTDQTWHSCKSLFAILQTRLETEHASNTGQFPSSGKRVGRYPPLIYDTYSTGSHTIVIPGHEFQLESYAGGSLALD